MLTEDELAALESLLVRARAAAGADRSESGGTVNVGDLVQLRPGADSHWQTSLLLVCKIRDDGRVSGVVLRPHRSGSREAWYTYSVPEVLRIGRAPFPPPEQAVNSASYLAVCPRCLERDGAAPRASRAAGQQDGSRPLPLPEPKPIQRATRGRKEPSRSVGDPGWMGGDCTVSILGQDGQTYTLDVKASSLFDAAFQAVQSWSTLWWYNPDAVIEVRAGDQSWKMWAPVLESDDVSDVEDGSLDVTEREWEPFPLPEMAGNSAPRCLGRDGSGPPASFARGQREIEALQVGQHSEPKPIQQEIRVIPRWPKAKPKPATVRKAEDMAALIEAIAGPGWKSNWKSHLPAICARLDAERVSHPPKWPSWSGQLTASATPQSYAADLVIKNIAHYIEVFEEQDGAATLPEPKPKPIQRETRNRLVTVTNRPDSGDQDGLADDQQDGGEVQIGQRLWWVVPIEEQQELPEPKPKPVQREAGRIAALQIGQRLWVMPA